MKCKTLPLDLTLNPNDITNATVKSPLSSLKAHEQWQRVFFSISWVPFKYTKKKCLKA